MATDPVEVLRERFPDIDFAPAPLVCHAKAPSDQICVRVPGDRLLAVMRFLRDDPRTKFEQLADLTCVDYLNFPGARDRYGVTYSLLSLTHNRRLWVKCFVNDPDPDVPSLCSLWKGAEGPDLRRILTWEGFGSYPLRKDYPLQGKGEREAYKVITRESA